MVSLTNPCCALKEKPLHGWGFASSAVQRLLRVLFRPATQYRALLFCPMYLVLQSIHGKASIQSITELPRITWNGSLRHHRFVSVTNHSELLTCGSLAGALRAGLVSYVDAKGQPQPFVSPLATQRTAAAAGACVRDDGSAGRRGPSAEARPQGGAGRLPEENRFGELQEATSRPRPAPVMTRCMLGTAPARPVR